MALGRSKMRKSGKGAAQAIRSNVARSRIARPGRARSNRSSNDTDAANRVGGLPGMGGSYPR